MRKYDHAFTWVYQCEIYLRWSIKTKGKYSFFTIKHFYLFQLPPPPLLLSLLGPMVMLFSVTCVMGIDSFRGFDSQEIGRIYSCSDIVVLVSLLGLSSIFSRIEGILRTSFAYFCFFGLPLIRENCDA